jgi:hypothetical protein
MYAKNIGERTELINSTIIPTSVKQKHI